MVVILYYTQQPFNSAKPSKKPLKSGKGQESTPNQHPKKTPKRGKGRDPKDEEVDAEDSDALIEKAKTSKKPCLKKHIGDISSIDLDKDCIEVPCETSNQLSYRRPN
ncbi:hypothetical protein PCASD_21830 [Puccinia coronata f. sp. avenae]|uniref:Uncharacterized protein n=1 Tax=Puccinia coronata f. sp. avenae TaxID=200324 RepID=A0A2N5S7S5_9BASI|nr:hypothetical protein PCASD_21830 [Puccinia coronata f. sp. avenae]